MRCRVPTPAAIRDACHSMALSAGGRAILDSISKMAGILHYFHLLLYFVPGAPPRVVYSTRHRCSEPLADAEATDCPSSHPLTPSMRPPGDTMHSSLTLCSQI